MSEDDEQSMADFMRERKESMEYIERCKKMAQEMAERTSISLESETLMPLWLWLQENTETYYQAFTVIRVFTEFADKLKKETMKFPTPTGIQLARTLGKLCEHTALCFEEADRMRAELEKDMPKGLKEK